MTSCFAIETSAFLGAYFFVTFFLATILEDAFFGADGECFFTAVVFRFFEDAPDSAEVAFLVRGAECFTAFFREALATFFLLAVRADAVVFGFCLIVVFFLGGIEKNKKMNKHVVTELYGASAHGTKCLACVQCHDSPLPALGLSQVLGADPF